MRTCWLSRSFAAKPAKLPSVIGLQDQIAERNPIAREMLLDVANRQIEFADEPTGTESRESWRSSISCRSRPGGVFRG